MLNQAFVDLAEKIVREDGEITRQQALELAHAGPELSMDLIVLAGKIRQRFTRKAVFTCAIINAKSGMCPEDCAFCAQSAHHRTDAPTYAMLDAGELERTGLAMAAAGATNYSMVTSGSHLTDSEIDTVCRVAGNLKRKTDLTLCASVGRLTARSARQLKAAGITRYHHNLETARSHFETICTTHDFDDAVETVRLAQQAGLAACSGAIFGMGETWAQRVELAFTLRELEVDSVPVNFLNPIAGTRLEERPLLPPMEALKCIALYRFIHPKRHITVCGGREATLNDFQSWIFAAGANGVMVGNYLTTQGRSIDADLEMIAGMGLEKEPAR